MGDELWAGAEWSSSLNSRSISCKPILVKMNRPQCLPFFPSLFLFRLGLAPHIHDLYGKVKFTGKPISSPNLHSLGGVLGVRGLMKGTCPIIAAEELSNMASELAKYDLQLPAFSKIGGILANELSVDEAAGRDQAHLLVSLSGYGRTLSLMPPHKLWLPLIIGRAI